MRKHLALVMGVRHLQSESEEHACWDCVGLVAVEALLSAWEMVDRSS